MPLLSNRMGKKKAKNGGSKKSRGASNSSSFFEDSYAVRRRNGDFDTEEIDNDRLDAEINSDYDGSNYEPSLSARIFLWEFSQNDSKRDSGSKMVRLGYANKLSIGQSFPGK